MSQVEELRNSLDQTMKQRADLVERMASQSELVVSAIVREIADRWGSDVEGARKKYASHVKSLDPDEIREIKAALEDLQRRAGEVVSPHFDKDELWIHRQSLDEPETLESQFASRRSVYAPSDTYNRRPVVRYPNILSEAIREARGEVGQILSRIIPETDEMERPSWQRSGWRRYPYGLHDPTPEVREQLSGYADMDLELSELTKQAKRLRREITEAEADELWQGS